MGWGRYGTGVAKQATNKNMFAMAVACQQQASARASTHLLARTHVLASRKGCGWTPLQSLLPPRLWERGDRARRGESLRNMCLPVGTPSMRVHVLAVLGSAPAISTPECQVQARRSLALEGIDTSGRRPMLPEARLGKSSTRALVVAGARTAELIR